VDDEETIRHVLRQVLEQNGCDLFEAGSAEEGFGLVAEVRSRFAEPARSKELRLDVAIAKRLVEEMGGTIGVRSSHGLGSSFWFTVPLALQAAAPSRSR
jgi:CheY-like chemotaxis protein